MGCLLVDPFSRDTILRYERPYSVNVGAGVRIALKLSEVSAWKMVAMYMYDAIVGPLERKANDLAKNICRTSRPFSSATTVQSGVRLLK